MRLSWLTVAALLLVAGLATAQEVRTPRVEIGANLSGFLPIFFPEGPVVLAGVGPRLALNISRGIGLQFYADAVGPVENIGLNGLYAGEFKIPLRHSRDRQRTLSLTMGLCAPFHYRHVSERRIPRPDGSIVVHEAHRRFRANAPTTVIVGVARDYALGRYASTNLALQAMAGPIGGVALRAAIGVSFGPGGYR